MEVPVGKLIADKVPKRLLKDIGNTISPYSLYRDLVILLD